MKTTHPATRSRTAQRRRRYASNETPNDVSVERRQDVSVVRLHDVLLVCRDHVSRGRNDDVSSVRLHNVLNETPNDVSVVRLYDVSCNSQMKHPITSLWYVSELRCRDDLSLLWSLLRFKITLSWPPAGRFSRLI